MGNVLPSTIGGDVLRVTRSAKNIGSSETAFAAVALERLSGFLALPVICFFGFVVDPSLLESSTAWVALLVSGITLAALAAILVLAAPPADGGPVRAPRELDAVHRRHARRRRTAPARAAAALAVLGTAMIYQVSVVLTVGFVILTIGAPVPVGAVIAFVPVVAMAQVVPISLSGLGVREGMFVLLLHPARHPRTGQAIGIGLLWYLTMLARELPRRARVRGRQPSSTPRSEPDRAVSTTTTIDRRTDVHRKLWAAKTPARRPRPLLVGGDHRDPALLPRVLRDPEQLTRDPTRRCVRAHAKQLIDWQRSLGINHEQTLNEWALHFTPLVIVANYFYGSLHFIVTIGVGDLPLPQVAERLPALAQHARHRHRDRTHRLPVLAAHAAAPARHRCRTPPWTSSTPSPSTRRSGRSTRAR